MATSSASSEIAGFGPRRFAGRLLGVLAGSHGVERGAGHAPGGADPPQAVGQTRAGRGGRHSSPRPPAAPKGRRSPSWPQAVPTCMVNSPIRFMALSSSACTGSPLRCLSEASIPPIAFSRHCSSPEDIYAQLARQKLHRLVTQKPQNDLTLARHPSIAGQVPAGLPAKPGLGKTWTSQARPHLPQAHQQQLSSQNYRSCSGPPWTLRLSQFCVQGNRVRLKCCSA